MRASRQPWQRAQRREHVARSPAQRDGRRFEIVAVPRRDASTERSRSLRQATIAGAASPHAPAGRQRERREHVPGRHRDARIDQHRGERRQRERRRQHLADAAHHARPRIEADRHVGADRRAPPCSRRGSSSVSRLARASRRSAAAASDEPPPRPAATGRRLSSVKRPSLRPGDFGRERARRLEHEIVVDRPGRGRGRAATVERQRRARRQASAGRRRRRTPPGCRARDSRRRGGRARAASD